MNFPEVLRRIVAALEFCGIPYMVTGSFAGVAYGSPRSTQDIDLVIAADAQQLRSLGMRLPVDEYYFDLEAALDALKNESLFNVIDQKTGWKIDMIIRKSRTFSRAEFSRRCLVTAEGARLFIASAEDLILAKLEWAKLGQSKRQIEDVVRIMQTQGNVLDLAYLQKWVAELSLEKQWRDAQAGADPSGLNISPE